MAPESGKEVVRKALAMGADDALLISDPAAEGSDVWGTAHALAKAIASKGFDLVICGTQSTDAITGELPGMLAELLGVPGLTYVRKLELDGTTLRAERETDNGYMRISAPLPALASVTKSINEPRYPSLRGIMGAKKKTIAVADAGRGRASTARSGSPARGPSSSALETPPTARQGRGLSGAGRRRRRAEDPRVPAGEEVRLMRDVVVFIEHTEGQPRRVSLEMATKAKELAGALGGSVHAVVLGKGAGGAAEQLRAYPVDTIHVAEDPDVDAFLVDPAVDYVARGRDVASGRRSFWCPTR